MKKLQLGAAYLYNGTIPCIEIIRKKDNVVMGHGYLSAFRDYCFQVSGTWDGDGDRGSTPVFGLDTFGSIEQRGMSNLSQQSTAKFIITAVANYAVTCYAASAPYNDKYIYKEAGIEEIPVEGYIPITGIDYNTDYQWEIFREMCYNRYVLHHTKKELSEDFAEINCNSKEDFEILSKKVAEEREIRRKELEEKYGKASA